MESKARSEVIKLMTEAMSHHNDGYVMAGAKKELTEINEMIGNFLLQDTRDLSAEPYIYESPDGEKVYRRKRGAPHNTRELIKG